MEQFEQLLTCAICLDRYRNPKLLPCQHSFCMEPCLDGLVDYVRRQIKCPECRAEHRIPYQGVQGYPTNVTLQRFLELHIEITGELPDPTSGQVMERCNVCSEKSYCSYCWHCDKKICEECKLAHMEILRREITRINNQIRRGIHRLQDSLSLVEKNTQNIQGNCTSVGEEVDEIFRRLSKALKDRTEYLRSELDRYVGTELRNLTTLKVNLEQEISNILSNCDLVDKHMNDSVDMWDDCELMDAKEIFLRTVEFIRNFEYENADYTRKIRLILAHDPNQLVLHVAAFGDLNVATHHLIGGGVSGAGGVGGGTSTSLGVGASGVGLLQAPGPASGLMRSKSDHRLASQFRQDEQQRGGYDDDVIGGRKFGDRSKMTTDRYGYQRSSGVGDAYGTDDYEESRPTRSRFSRFSRRHCQDVDSDNDVPSRGVRFNEAQHHSAQLKEREKVLDTEDVARGPLSGITRLADSPRVMKKLQEKQAGGKKKDKETTTTQAGAAVASATPTTNNNVVVNQATAKKSVTTGGAMRQLSEDDEIAKIKKQNKGATTSTTDSVEPRTLTERISSTEERHSTNISNNVPQKQPSASSTLASEAAAASSDEETEDVDEENEDESISSLQQTQRKTAASKVAATAAAVRRQSSSSSSDTITGGVRKKSSTARSASSESNASTESSTTSRGGASSSMNRTPKFNTPSSSSEQSIVKDSVSRGKSLEQSSGASSGGSGRVFQSRFLRNRSATATPPSSVIQKQASSKEESISDDSSSSEEESDDDSDEDISDNNANNVSNNLDNESKDMAKSDIGPLLARSAYVRVNSSEVQANANGNQRNKNSAQNISNNTKSNSNTTPWTNRAEEHQPLGTARYRQNRFASSSTNNSKEKSPPLTSSSTTNNRYKYSSMTNDNDSTTTVHPVQSRYPYSSRFLNKSKSSGIVQPDEEDSQRLTNTATDESQDLGSSNKYSSASNGRARYMALKDRRRQQLARSKSIQQFGDDNDTNENTNNDADVEPMSPTSTNPNAYLASRGYPTSGSTSVVNDLSRSRSSHTMKSRDNSPEPRPTSSSNLDKDGGAALSSWARYLKNKYGNRNSTIANKDNNAKKEASSESKASDASGGGVVAAATRRLAMRASGSSDLDEDSKNMQGSPTTTPTQQIGIGAPAATAGTSPKSLYVQKGRPLFEIGSRGSETGCFTWPRGVAIGPDNAIVVADSSNHRVQVFDAHGRFVREFGQYGNGDGEFDCLAGVAVNRIGQYIIADRYNHRIQVFDPSGRFLRAFGSQGSADGKFNYPWGIATDALGFIYVCDKENHRIQVFQSDGKFVGKFGTMGGKDGQLEHPHYVAVWNTNNPVIIISDSNNHRIQVFDTAGRLLNNFGGEGSSEGQFKFPRGVAVDEHNGYICVADSGNNRVQIFQPDGTFVRAFGTWGSGRGEFKALEGVAVSGGGHVLVCDRENHRIQVF